MLPRSFIPKEGQSGEIKTLFVQHTVWLRGTDPPNSAHSVDVVGHVGREVVVDDVEHVGRVDAARNEVRARKNFEFSRQKLVENSSADSPVDLKVEFSTTCA